MVTVVLHDAVAEPPFEAAFDARFPYSDAEAASALIAQGCSMSARVPQAT